MSATTSHYEDEGQQAMLPSDVPVEPVNVTCEFDSAGGDLCLDAKAPVSAPCVGDEASSRKTVPAQRTDGIGSHAFGFDGMIERNWYTFEPAYTRIKNSQLKKQVLKTPIRHTILTIQTIFRNSHTRDLFDSRWCTAERWTATEINLRYVVYTHVPTEEDYAARAAAVKNMQTFLQGVWSVRRYGDMKLDCVPFGSYESGLYDRHGDVDLLLKGIVTEKKGEKDTFRVMDLEDGKADVVWGLAYRMKSARQPRFRDIAPVAHARIPLIKCKDIDSGVEMDLVINGPDGVYKSRFIGVISCIDWRMSALFRLVKLFLRLYGLNDAANGSFNSHTIVLLVIFHLQTRTDPIVPSIKSLFATAGLGQDERPLDDEKLIEDEHAFHTMLVQVAENACKFKKSGVNKRNRETLLELFLSFLKFMQGLVRSKSLALKGDMEMQHVTVSTWHGAFMWKENKSSRRDKLVSVEEPFMADDNCARSVEYAHAERLQEAIVHACAKFSACSSDKDVSLGLNLEGFFGSDVVSEVLQSRPLHLKKKQMSEVWVSIIISMHTRDDFYEF